MLDGGCGMRPVTVFDTEGYRSRVAAEVSEAEIDARLSPLERRRWSRSDDSAWWPQPKRWTIPACWTTG